MRAIQTVAVVGHPIGHTMSPFLHQRLFSLQNTPLRYQALDIADLASALEQLRSFDCFNVTIPHKTGIIPFLDEIDEKACVCGSVNTVRVRDGRLCGTTTDGAGCRKALECHGLDFSGEILLLGNGGAARAIAFEMAACQERLHLTIACRAGSYEKAKSLGEEIAVFYTGQGKRNFRIVIEKYEELEMDAASRYNLLINASSVGMYPHTGVSPVSKNVIARCCAVFDVVYNPKETELLRLGKEAGIPTVGGMEMLVYQAVAAHQFWYGWTFQDKDILRLCLDAEREMEKRFQGREEKA